MTNVSTMSDSKVLSSHPKNKTHYCNRLNQSYNRKRWKHICCRRLCRSKTTKSSLHPSTLNKTGLHSIRRQCTICIPCSPRTRLYCRISCRRIWRSNCCKSTWHSSDNIHMTYPSHPGRCRCHQNRKSSCICSRWQFEHHNGRHRHECLALRQLERR